MSKTEKRNLTTLWLIIGLCLAPIVASYLAYFYFLPQGHLNYGELIGPQPLPVAKLQLDNGGEFNLSDLRGKWLLVMTDAGKCDEPCRAKLFAIRQLRLAQGKDASRIERVWLISDSQSINPELNLEFKGTWLARATGSELLKALPATRAPEDHIYLVDPLGNLVLRYPLGADPTRIIKDMTRLLKASRIG